MVAVREFNCTELSNFISYFLVRIWFALKKNSFRCQVFFQLVIIEFKYVYAHFCTSSSSITSLGMGFKFVSAFFTHKPVLYIRDMISFIFVVMFTLHYDLFALGWYLSHPKKIFTCFWRVQASKTNKFFVGEY